MHFLSSQILHGYSSLHQFHSKLRFCGYGVRLWHHRYLANTDNILEKLYRYLPVIYLSLHQTIECLFCQHQRLIFEITQTSNKHLSAGSDHLMLQREL